MNQYWSRNLVIKFYIHNQNSWIYIYIYIHTYVCGYKIWSQDFWTNTGSSWRILIGWSTALYIYIYVLNLHLGIYPLSLLHTNLCLTWSVIAWYCMQFGNDKCWKKENIKEKQKKKKMNSVRYRSDYELTENAYTSPSEWAMWHLLWVFYEYFMRKILIL